MKDTAATITTLPPGPKGLPIVGDAWQFGRDPLGFVRDMQQSYGRMATVHIGKAPIMLCFRPEHVRYFLTEQQRNFTRITNRGGIGNLRLLLATILQRYTPRLVPGFRVVLQPRVTLRPKYGMRMILDAAPAHVYADNHQVSPV